MAPRVYPINPTQMASYRESFRPSGAKGDPSDAELLCQFVSLHHLQLGPWYPDANQCSTWLTNLLLAGLSFCLPSQQPRPDKCRTILKVLLYAVS